MISFTVLSARTPREAQVGKGRFERDKLGESMQVIKISPEKTDNCIVSLGNLQFEVGNRGRNRARAKMENADKDV